MKCLSVFCIFASGALSAVSFSIVDDDDLFYNITVIAQINGVNKVDFDVINVNIYNLNGGLKKNYTGLIIKEQPIYDIQCGAVSNLPWIKFIRFENDEIEAIATMAFYNLPSLKTLSITGNPLLRNITDNVFQCSNLNELYLYENSIVYINPGAFAGLPELRILGLDMNNIKRINYKWFVPTKYLFILFLNYNKLSKIREKDLRSLRDADSNGLKLHFSHNKIRRVDQGVFQGMDIDHLNLSYNNLKSLSGDVFEVIRKLRLVDLTGNDISCTDKGQLLISLFSIADNVTKSDGWDETCIPTILQQ